MRHGYLKPFKRYEIPAGAVHSAIMDTFCIFANWETWEGDGKPKSAAEDFTAV